MLNLYKKRAIVIILLCISILGLAACKRQPDLPVFERYQPLTQEEMEQKVELECAGVNVIKQGDNLRLIIPTDIFFDFVSSTVHPNRQKTLHLLADFVKAYADRRIPYAQVRVYGYSDDMLRPRRRTSLSYQQAATVAAYIWDAGIKRSQIIIRGFGADYPIASNYYPGTALNRRVEVRVG